MTRFTYDDIVPVRPTGGGSQSVIGRYGAGRYFGLECALDLYFTLRAGPVNLAEWARRKGISYKTASRLVDVLSSYAPITEERESIMRILRLQK